MSIYLLTEVLNVLRQTYPSVMVCLPVEVSRKTKLHEYPTGNVKKTYTMSKVPGTKETT